jgi:hypothetical protein
VPYLFKCLCNIEELIKKCQDNSYTPYVMYISQQSWRTCQCKGKSLFSISDIIRDNIIKCACCKDTKWCFILYRYCVKDVLTVPIIICMCIQATLNLKIMIYCSWTNKAFYPWLFKCHDLRLNYISLLIWVLLWLEIGYWLLCNIRDLKI